MTKKNTQLINSASDVYHQRGYQQGFEDGRRQGGEEVLAHVRNELLPLYVEVSLAGIDFEHITARIEETLIDAPYLPHKIVAGKLKEYSEMLAKRGTRLKNAMTEKGISPEHINMHLTVVSEIQDAITAVIADKSLTDKARELIKARDVNANILDLFESIDIGGRPPEGRTRVIAERGKKVMSRYPELKQWKLRANRIIADLQNKANEQGGLSKHERDALEHLKTVGNPGLTVKNAIKKYS